MFPVYQEWNLFNTVVHDVIRSCAAPFIVTHMEHEQCCRQLKLGKHYVDDTTCNNHFVNPPRELNIHLAQLNTSMFYRDMCN
jgi:hypothetical protein